MTMCFGIVNYSGKRRYCLYPNISVVDAVRLIREDGGELIDIDQIPEFEFRYSMRTSHLNTEELPSVRLMERCIDSVLISDNQSYEEKMNVESCGAYLVRMMFEFIPEKENSSKTFIEVYDAIVAEACCEAERYARRMSDTMIKMGYFDDDVGIPGRLLNIGITTIAALPDKWLEFPSVVTDDVTTSPCR